MSVESLNPFGPQLHSFPSGHNCIALQIFTSLQMLVIARVKLIKNRPRGVPRNYTAVALAILMYDTHISSKKKTSSHS